MDRAIGIGLENVSKTIEGRAASLATSLRDAIGTAAREFDAEALQASEALNKAGDQFSEQLGSKSEEFARALEERSNEIAGRIGETQNRLASQAAAVAQAFSEAGNSIMHKVAEAGTLVEKQVGSINQSLEVAQQQLDQRGEAIRGKLGQTVASIEGTLQSVDQTMVARGAELRSSLNQTADDINTAIQAVDKALEARGEAIRANLDTRTRDLNSMLASRSAELSRLIEEQARPLVNLNMPKPVVRRQKKLAAAAEEGASRVSAAAEGSSLRVRQESASIVEAITARTNETLAAISERTQMAAGTVRNIEHGLLRNVEDLIGRLETSNTGISSLIDQAAREIGVTVDQASARLAAADQKLDAAAARFTESTSTAADMVASSSRLLDNNVDRLTHISGHTLVRLAALSGALTSTPAFSIRPRNFSEQPSRTSPARSPSVRMLCAPFPPASFRGRKRSRPTCATFPHSWKVPCSALKMTFRGSGRSHPPEPPVFVQRHKPQSRRGTARSCPDGRGHAQRPDECKRRGNAGNRGNTLRSREAFAMLADRMRAVLPVLWPMLKRCWQKPQPKSDSAADYMRRQPSSSVEEAVQRFAGATDEIRRAILRHSQGTG